MWDHDVDVRAVGVGCCERFPMTGVGGPEYVEPVTQPYLRFPHIHGDQVAFIADDDVWLAPVSGGRAWRLTSDHAPATTPRFSPDGARLAYVSHKDGHPEAYVIDLSDGATRRLTWLGGTTAMVLGWDDAGRVLVASNAGAHERSLTVVRAVGLDGVVETLRYGPAWGVAEHRGPDGARTTALVSAGYRTPAYWKRYRGGTASVLWIDRGPAGPDSTADWQRPLPDDEAGTYDPIWIGDALVFTSDRGATFPDHADEQANLWVLDGLARGTETPEPRQLTTQTEAEGYVRDATSDGSRIVWHSRGDLWLLDGLDGTPRRLDITLTGALPQPYSTDPDSSPSGIDGLAVDKSGDTSVVSWLGTAFWVTHRAGPARALVADPSVRVREPVLLGDSGRAVVVTDAPRSTAEGESREDALEIHSLPGASGVAPDAAPQRLAGGELGRVLHLAASPSGDKVAAISHDGRVSLVAMPADGAAVAPGTITLLGRSGNGEAESPTFSPDGRYLAWSSPTGVEADHHQILVADLHAESLTATPLTSGRFHDFSPAFSDDGKYVVFLSDRTFDPSYDSHEFALSFSAATRPWLIPLAATEPAPFGPSADGWRLGKPDDKDGDGGGKDHGKDGGTGSGEAGDAKPDEHKHDEPASPDIDFDGAEERVVPFPVTSGRYRDLRAAKDGVLWVHETDDAGVLGSRHAGTEEDPAPNALQYWSFETRKATDISEKVSGYAVSGDGERAVIRSGSRLSTQSATSKPGDDDPSAFDIDLSRVRYEVDPRAQWHQMFDENARIMRDHYWRADMNGVDWDGVVARWRPLIDRIATHDDLEDVLWETVAELNTSHAYVRRPQEPGDTSRKLGLLGADLTRTPEGWRIERVLPSESSDPGARSPLRAAGVGARPGDQIVAVDGRPVDPVAGPSANLVGAAEIPVELTLRRSPSNTEGEADGQRAGSGTAGNETAGRDRRVVVVPLANESDLRYQDWVRSRREYVAEKSGGRLGYVHVPDMMSTGWAQLHRDLRLAADCEGIVVDVRFNGGGHTSQLVIARLAARVAGWGLNRHYDRPSSYPDRAARGPVVLVTNEYAGSDGDIVNAAAQALGVGPVVGVRTWGGVVGIDGRFDLVDGTGITQPRYAFWLDGKGFDVENYGVDPDIEVRHTPADYFSDVDPQLDAGMAEAFRRLAERPAATPPALPEPRVRH
jgi:tricorn protease